MKGANSPAMHPFATLSLPIAGPIPRQVACGIVLILSLFSCGCEDTNLFLLTDAGVDAVKAVTLSDEEVENIATQASRASDSEHQLAPPQSPYSRRLQQLVAPYTGRDEFRFNFRVYLKDQVNAFAMADGSIRIYSGLMDLMDDRELLFVIGHEMGHVVNKHSRKKVVLAYASSALRKGLASQENQLGQIARSTLGAFAHKLANAQFSQYEEKQADNYGAAFLQEQGYHINSAVSALRKFEQLAKRHTFLSSHPDPAKRAARLESGEYQDDLQKSPSLLASLFDTLKRWCIALLQFILQFF